jgi:hypothetical protein
MLACFHMTALIFPVSEFWMLTNRMGTSGAAETLYCNFLVTPQLWVQAKKDSGQAGMTNPTFADFSVIPASETRRESFRERDTNP